jgi:hypothetical protein
MRNFILIFFIIFKLITAQASPQNHLESGDMSVLEGKMRLRCQFVPADEVSDDSLTSRLGGSIKTDSSEDLWAIEGK